VEVPVVDIAGAEAAMIKPPKAVRGARRRDTALDALVTDGSTGTGRRHPASKQQENRAHA
jgi:hypothetical protein